MKLTLDKSWELCLKQWKWIAKQIRAGDKSDIESLKIVWLNKRGFNGLYNDCFFCEYYRLHPTPIGDNCNCPARKIEKAFSCYNTKYHYRKKPLKFYAKLLELNRKRK